MDIPKAERPMKTTSTLFLSLGLLLSAGFTRATNYINNGTFAAYNLNSGDTLRIAQGTFTGVITSLPAGAIIIVAPNANFVPQVINIWAPAGKIINNGRCQFSAMGIGAGFSVDNYGSVIVQGDMSFYSGALKKFENFSNSLLTVNGNLSLNDNTTINNLGLINMTGSLNLYSSTARINNKGVIGVTGNLSNQGQLINENIINIEGNLNYWGGQISNTGQITPLGTFSVGSGLTYTNSCKLITSGPINNYGTFQNSGLVWAGTTNTAADAFNNSGSFISATGAKLRTATFTNYSTITGSGFFYATGQTTLGSHASVGITGVTTDTIKIFDVTRSNASNVFDNQWGTVRPNAVYRSFPAPDSLQLFPGCSQAYRDGMVLLPVKWNYFYAKLVQQQPVLYWSAEYEAGMQFEIQRSYDNTSFTGIGTLTSSTGGDYAYPDATADMHQPYVSYRIKGMSTINGAVKYTEVRLIRNTENQTSSVAVFPNPTKGKAVVNYKAANKQPITVRVRSVAGLSMVVKNLTAEAGLNQFEINEIGTLLPGTYFIEVLSENIVISTDKLVKQ
ncbi:MAG: T9SS type A sorting domain-containing protein [Chitinophagaceae bacterium]